MKWVIIVYGLSLALEMLILTLTMNIIQDFDFNNITVVRNILFLPLMYLVGRVSLIFPATALDLRRSLKWSWNETRNNGVNILCIVGLLPWFMYIFLSFLQREEPTIIEQAILTLLTYLVSAIGIFALSLTYRALQINAQKNSNQLLK
jgi:Tfp pilus assembly protein PilN